MKITRVFIFSAGLVLLITGLSKLISSFGTAHVLQMPCPILVISFRDVFFIVGSLELVIAYICVSRKHVVLQAGLVAWMSTNFLIYRLGLGWIGYHKPCSCLGNLTDMLHISPHAADVFMQIAMSYLILGSYVTLVWFWRQRRKRT